MSNDPMSPSLRELIEQRIAAERSLTDHRFAAERERSDATYSALVQLLDQRHSMISDSLRLQANEYERRMTVLNHAHENAVKEQARVLPREMHDAFVREYNAFKDSLMREFNQYKQVGLPREMHESFVREHNQFKDTITAEFNAYRQKTGEELKAIQTRAVTWNAAIGIFFVIVMIAIRFIPMR